MIGLASQKYEMQRYEWTKKAITETEQCVNQFGEDFSALAEGCAKRSICQ